MSVVCDHLLTFIAGKMTPVMQITDVAVAFNLKNAIEASKAELRRSKRGNIIDVDADDVTGSAEDLMRIFGRSWKKLKGHDEVDRPDRLLKAARACGWLSYRADPVTKALVKCAEEPWMAGREDELPEKTHRHPESWWEERYRWVNAEGEPRKPDFSLCGRSVNGLEYMRDEFPEQEPNEKTRLQCLSGHKVHTLHCIDLTEGPAFPEVAQGLMPEEFLKTQREKLEAAHMRILLSGRNNRQKRQRPVLDKVNMVMLRAKTKRKLVRKPPRYEQVYC